MSFPQNNLPRNNQASMSRSTEDDGGIRHDSDFSRIEELIKGNKFSSEEISHLMEILNSRLESEWEKQKPSTYNGGQAELFSRMLEIQKTPTKGKDKEIPQNVIGTFPENSDVPYGVGASPIDIARAYMAGRTCEGVHDASSFMSNGERAQPRTDFARNPLLAPPSPKPAICWPGAMVHEHHGYATPQSQRGRHRLHDFPRTPYSRAISSNSATKLPADSRYASTSSPFQTSINDQAKLRGDPIDGYGSVGPIRRIRNKFASGVRHGGSIFQNTSKNVSSELVKPKVSGGFLSGSEKNLEPGETSGASKYCSGNNLYCSSDRGIQSPISSSSQAVKKILEHLDRHKPTPKEKEAELKLATSWRRSPHEASDTRLEGKNSSLQGEELSSQRNADIAGPSFLGKLNKSSSKSNYLVNFHDKAMDEAKDAVNDNGKASSAVFTGSSMTPGANAKPSFGRKVNFSENAFGTTDHGSAETGFRFSRPDVSNGLGTMSTATRTGSEFPKNHGPKTSLPPISISKPVFPSVSFDNGPSFSFPVSAASGGLSEPPTPSITPSSSANELSQPTDACSVPFYSFGTKKSTQNLVFSFPSTSSASTHEEYDLKFNFGSDKKARLSFSSFGKDGVCS